jgi:hypothetical protein
MMLKRRRGEKKEGKGKQERGGEGESTNLKHLLNTNRHENALLRGERRDMQEINRAYEEELKQVTTETTSKISTYYVGDMYGLEVN